MPSFDVSWTDIGYNLSLLTVAFVLAMPIAWDRERGSRSAGLRTFPLVAMASCGYIIVGMQVLDSTDAEARVMQGLITGIGFIGGGAILKSKSGITGTATAASLWNTGLIGSAVAWQRFEIAILLSLANFIVLRFGWRVKQNVDKEDRED